MSIARELAGRGHRVTVVSREASRATASWAASGILPAPGSPDGSDPLGQLTAMSHQLHFDWAEQLANATGIDTGLRRCGGLYLADTLEARNVLDRDLSNCDRIGIRATRLDARGIAELEPALTEAVREGRIVGGWLSPDEVQIRPSRHLRAVRQSCLAVGVTLLEEHLVMDLEPGTSGGPTLRVRSPAGSEHRLQFRKIVVAAGAWSETILAQAGLAVRTRPLRGQILLLRFPRPPVQRVINRRLEYLVPREDGHVLVGSTIEDAGFAAHTTTEALAALQRFAAEMLGDCSHATIETAWAGLRPGWEDGLPVIGPIPAANQIWVATGHFRSGLHLSPATAVLLADLIEGRRPEIDPRPFSPARFPALLARA